MIRKFTKSIFIFLIYFYRTAISPYKGYPSCRFTPTCSKYAIDAFRKNNLYNAIILTIIRILRCNPFGRHGDDPVPVLKKKQKNK